MIKKLRSKRGFTLVELMIVVAIVGVLAALAIYGVRKYIANAKTAEARNSIGQMSKDATTAFVREGMDPKVLTLGESTGNTNRLCGASTAVPTLMSSVQGKKFQSQPSDWATGDKNAGWQCLKFSMADPQYYQYSYLNTGTDGAVGNTFECVAQGDLNGDGTAFSKFSIKGDLQAGADGVVQAIVAPTMEELNPEE
jgi:type IV pilus assembly protein PilA